MQWALVYQVTNIVQNVVAYDPPSETDDAETKVRKTFIPTEGLTLRQVNDWIVIGGDADAPQPQQDQQGGN